MVSSAEQSKNLDLKCLEYEIDQRNEKLYNEYLDKKTDYVYTTKDLFSQITCSDTVIELGDFEPINYNEKYSANTLQLVEKAQRTGMFQLSARGYKSVPEFVWTFGMPFFDKGEMSEVYRNVYKIKKTQRVQPTPLVHLDLSKNFITSFTPKAPMEYLELLKLDHCRLESVSEKLLLFRSLKILLLHNNELKWLPSCLGHLDSLQEIQVQSNHIAMLPSNLFNAHSLKKINVSENQLIRISSFEVHLPNLEELKASNNQLLSIGDGIQLLTSLKIIDFSSNQLPILPDLSSLPNLKKFNANYNQLVVFPNFKGCKCLTEIQLKSNRIQEIVLENLQSVPVEKLLLDANKIQMLPEKIDELSTLVSLCLSKNKIKNLPHRLALIEPLREVNIQGNPIEGIEISILSSTKQLLGYLMKQHKEVLKRSESLKKRVDEGLKGKKMTEVKQVAPQVTVLLSHKKPTQAAPIQNTIRKQGIKKSGLQLVNRTHVH